jgi:hypothetical protein
MQDARFGGGTLCAATRNNTLLIDEGDSSGVCAGAKRASNARLSLSHEI